MNTSSADVLVYQGVQPISTVQKYLVIILANAIKEARFFHSLLKVWNIARNSRAKIEFYTDGATIAMIGKIKNRSNIDASFIIFNNWNEFAKSLRKNERQ